MKSAVISSEETLVNPPDQLDAMRQAIALLTQENRLLKEKINYLLHHRFGPKSEHFTDQQPLLFGNADTDTDEAPKEEQVLVPEHTRKKGGRRMPPKNLPRVRIEHDLSEAEKQCVCGGCLTRIDEEISEQYDVVQNKNHISGYGQAEQAYRSFSCITSKSGRFCRRRIAQRV